MEVPLYECIRIKVFCSVLPLLAIHQRVIIPSFLPLWSSWFLVSHQPYSESSIIYFLVFALRRLWLGLGLAFNVFHYLVNLLFQFLNLTFLTHRHNLSPTRKKKEMGIYNNAAASAAVISATITLSAHCKAASHLIR